MKIIKNIFCIALVCMLGSCTGDLAELNVDPNKSPTANPEEVLTASIGYMSYVVDAQYNRRSQLWGQYWTWGPGVAIGNVERYISAGNDYNNGWARMYSNALRDLKFVAESDSKAHAGVSKILQAYIFQGLVDHFGDVPFSEALSGEPENGGILSPSYDDDADIYAQLIPMIDGGLDDLAGLSDGLGAEDLLYGGDITKWTKFANSLKLRILMRQSMNSDVSAQVTSLIAAGNFIEGPADAAEVAFDGAVGDENPMYAYFERSLGNYFLASNTSMDYLRETNDPRLGAFYIPNSSGNFVSINQGSVDDQPFTASPSDFSQGSAVTYNNDNPVILMSDWEVSFLRAEAAVRFGTADDANSLFESALTQNFNYVGAVDTVGFVASLDFAGSSDADKVKTIAIQKWVSMNGLQEDEGWIETRRFDTDGNKIFSGVNGVFDTPAISVMPEGTHPSIWLYPQSEISLNPNSPAQRDLMGRVFWDN